MQPILKGILLVLLILFCGLNSRNVYAQALSTEDCDDVDANIINTNLTKNFIYCNYSSSGVISVRFDFENTSSTKDTNLSYHISWGDGNENTYGPEFSNVSHVYETDVATSFELVLTVTGASGCKEVKKETVYIGSNPNVLVDVGGSSYLCAPATYKFTVKGFKKNPPNTLYTFTINDGSETITRTHQELLQDSVLEHTFTQASTSGGFSVTGVASNNCSSSESTWKGIRVTEGPKAEIGLTSRSSYCVNQEIILEDNSTDGLDGNGNTMPYTASWEITPETGWNITTSSEGAKIIFTQPGDYTVVLTASPDDPNTNCQASSADMSFKIVAPPVADFTLQPSPTTNCINNTVSVLNTSTGEDVFWNWAVTDLDGQPVSNWGNMAGGDETSKEPVFNFTKPGQYNITLTANNGCEPSTKTETITIKGKPIVTFPTADQSYCESQIVNFSVNNDMKHHPQYDAQFGNISSYTWEVNVISGQGDYSFDNGTDRNSKYPVINFKTPAVYKVLVYATNECGVTSEAGVQTITINPLPDLQIEAPITTICETESIRLKATGADTYTWEPAPGLFTTDIDAEVIVAPTETTTYTVTGTNTTTGCISTQSVTVVVNPLPTVTVKNSAAEICFEQGTATLIASGADTYTWSPATGLSATEGNSVTASPKETTIYTVTGYNSETTCSNTATVTVTVNPLPVVNAGPDMIVCDNPTPIQLKGSSPAGGTWSGEHVSADGYFVPDGHGFFVLRYTYTDAKGCTNFDEKTIEVRDAFEANAGVDREVCLNSGNINLYGTPVGGSWSGSEYVSEAGTFTPSKAGTYTLTYTYYTGSCSTTDEMQVTVKPLPEAPVVNGNTNICYNSTTTLSVNTTNLVKWYSVASGGLPLPTNETNKYTTSPLTKSTYFYAEVTGENGCVGPRTQVIVTVRPLIPAPIVEPYSMCGPGEAVLVAEGMSPNGTEPIYNWYDSDGNLQFTGKTFTPSLTASGTYTYYAESEIDDCVSPRTEVKVTVYPALDNNTIAVTDNATTICYNQAPNKLIGSGPTPNGGNGRYTYRWESKSEEANSVYTLVYRATDPSYQPGSLTKSTWFRRVVMSAGCELASEPILITVLPEISNNYINNVPTICEGDVPATITGEIPEGGEGPDSYKYTWEISTDNGVSFTAAPGDNTKYDYTAPAPLTIPTLYRRSVTSGACLNNLSNVVRVNVLPKIENNTISMVNNTVCYGGRPGLISGVKPSGGNNSYTYLWEYSEDGVNYKVAPAPNTNITYAPYELTKTTLFRRKAISGECYDLSDPVEVVVHDLIANNTITASQAICTNTAPEELIGSDVTGGTGSYDFVWEYSTTNTPGSFIPVATGGRGKHYKPGALKETTYFRRSVTSGACAEPSNVVEILVYPEITRNTITLSQNIYYGQIPAPLSGSVPAGGRSENYTYLWEYSEDGTNFTPAADPNTGKNYAPEALTKDTWYRRIVYSGGCENISNLVKITITPPIANNLIQADQIICYNNRPATITGNAPTGGYGDYEYLWQASIQGPGRGWVTAAGISNDKDYTPQALTQTTWFRRLVISNTRTDESAAVMITVNAVLTNNEISTSQTICYDTAPATLTGTVPRGGSGDYNYLWEYSIEGPNSGYTIAPGANNRKDYNPRELVQNTWFRRIATSESCEELISNTVMITVTPLPAAPVVHDASICGGNAATLTAAGTGGRIEWYAGASGGTPINVGSTFTTPALYHTTTYYVQEVHSCVSPRIEVTVNVVEVTANAGPDITIIEGRKAELYATGGISYSWSPAISLNNPNIANPVATPEKTTTYIVTVKTEEGCVFTDEVTVTVLPLVSVPNTFTPNRDGINDIWMIENISKYPNCKVQVFNQWGNQVFISDGYQAPWDGSQNGQELPLATYYYIIQLDKDEKPITGSITIVK
ncbi:gliding motility-associated C-terminal domain-containing protein [Pontibacter silvestris]|uniref:Gliding motility-associated C-terminal domain-containing protein n=1 Tax=Pontibacter silvestris TaxID=2305183 RepID=A0ABW4X2Y9_9BACT|nr:gliding motility-associated C-terminal domain-containing protein [Pontibacter silvestris]MCC9135027.1 gliding motility-associated C-terminal domain-containing protein [Pontibacter silvestris]